MCTELSDLVDKFNRPEKVIFSIFSIIAIVCILISTFGIYSLVSLSAQQRKKEIAIRKVNGATIGSILQMFIKEYFVLLLVAALIAFPASYGMMRVWIESYVRQTSTPFWIYIVLFAGIGIIIVISIFWRVWNAAKQNPAEVVKTE